MVDAPPLTERVSVERRRLVYGFALSGAVAIRVSGGGGVTFGRLVEGGSWFVLVKGGGAVVNRVMLIWRLLTINVREGTLGIWFCLE